MKNPYTGILLGIIALGLRLLMGVFPRLAEFYFNYMFPAVRFILDHTFALLPLTAVYFLIPLLLIIIFFRFPSFKHINQWNSWKKFILFFLNLLGLMFFLFNLLWAFNYERVSISEKLGIAEDLVLNPQIIRDNYLQSMLNGHEYRIKAIGNDTLTNVMEVSSFPSEKEIDELLVSTLHSFGYKVRGNPVVRYIKPKGILRKLGIAGIYNPFTGEPNVDSSFGILQNAFTTAHELAHAYGVTGEAEANFLAYISLKSSENPILNYAAEYTLWRHLAFEAVSRLEQEDLDYVIAAIPPTLKADRAAIYENARKYSQWFPKLSETVNDTYLKAQGISQGSEDYDRFVNMLIAYNKKRRMTDQPAFH